MNALACLLAGEGDEKERKAQAKEEEQILSITRVYTRKKNLVHQKDGIVECEPRDIPLNMNQFCPA